MNEIQTLEGWLLFLLVPRAESRFELSDECAEKFKLKSIKGLLGSVQLMLSARELIMLIVETFQGNLSWFSRTELVL
jgi:hypothetical protein